MQEFLGVIFPKCGFDFLNHVPLAPWHDSNHRILRLEICSGPLCHLSCPVSVTALHFSAWHFSASKPYSIKFFSSVVTEAYSILFIPISCYIVSTNNMWVWLPLFFFGSHFPSTNIPPPPFSMWCSKEEAQRAWLADFENWLSNL